MLNGLVCFIAGFALASIYGNIFLSDKAKRKADEYAYNKVEEEDVRA
ncbi:hypothetical protein [Listeria booriae]|uniref:Uncharacterized protein n=1 Tax=Listeria booriae TaxID=1552123 RepID=A0A841WCS6_9LIST|nr:hypothetical protein [Listeria booriae]MBC1231530.1 hypothetical protein [Listeria booriae]MBC1801083.1 hypothetical protein [Listeria booriae]MBC2239801.1 hypothetical protein [Listeria booriae]